MSSAIIGKSTQQYSNEELVTPLLNTSDFWLDMSDSSKFTTSSTTRINTITDKSSTPKTITRTGTILFDPVRKTIMPNGITGVDYLTIGLPGPGTTEAAAETVFFVCHMNTNILNVILGQTSGFARAIRISQVSFVYTRIGGTSYTLPTTNPINRLFLASFVWQNGILTGYNNGVCIGSVAVPIAAQDATQTIFIGGGNSFRGGLAECILYQRALTSTQINGLNYYLMNKWKLDTSSLISSPLSLPGVSCDLWLDGNDASTITFGTGTAVQQWADKSGNNRHAIQNTAANRPTYNSSLRGVKFTSASNTGLISTCPFSQTETIFAVIDLLSTTAGNIIGTTNASRGRQIRLRNAGCIIVSDTTTLLTLRQSTFSSTIKHLFTYVNDGSTNFFQLNINSLIDSESNSALAYTAGSFNNVIGATTNSTTVAFDSNIYEIIVFNTALSPANRLEIEKYLTNKWSIPNTPITTVYSYPFYNSRPFTRVFFPPDFDGCILWLDAADSTTVTFVGGSTTDVSTWVDKSGNGYNATGTNNPQYITNGLNRYPIMQLRGASDRFRVGGYNFTDTSLAIFVVVRMATSQPSTNSLVGIVSHENNAGTQYGRSIYADRDALQYGIGFVVGTTQNRSLLSGYTYTPESWDIISTVFYGSATSITNIDGTNYNSSIASAAGNNTNGLIIGARDSAGTFATNNAQCDIAEIIVYNVARSPDQITVIESYLAQKWGLVSPFPSTHGSKLYRSLTTVFYPTQISACSLWLDPSDPSTITYSSSPNVSGIVDKTGTYSLFRNYATGFEITTANKLNGLQTLYFPNDGGGNDTRTTFRITSFSINATIHYIFFVVRFNPWVFINTTTPRTWPIIYPWHISSVNGPQVGVRLSGSDWRLAYDVTQVGVQAFGPTVATGSSGPSVGLPYIGMVAKTSATTYTFSLNGTLTTATAGSFSVSSGSCVIGPFFQNQELCELLIYNGITMTTSQIRAVEGYLAHKWGLVANLPSTHPFKKVKP